MVSRRVREVFGTHQGANQMVWSELQEFYIGGPRTRGAVLLIISFALLIGWLRSRLGTDDFLLEAMNNRRVGEYFCVRSSENAIRVICIRSLGNSPHKHEVLVLPYAAIVPPLSLLAAYLILKKPQRRSTTGIQDGSNHD